MRILLVEDHEDTRRALAALLRISGHDVTDVASGEAALACHQPVAPTKADPADTAQPNDAAVRSPSFDCALIDLGLPDMSGAELMPRLLERGLKKGIALTGSNSPADIAECKRAGFTIHLVKPVTIEELNAALKRL